MKTNTNNISNDPSQRFITLLSFTLAALVAVGCGKKSDDDDAAATTAETANLATAYPGGLNLSVLPQSAAASLMLAEPTAAERKVEQEKLLAGTATSCFPAANAKEFTREDDETCYEFDQDMVYGTNDTSVASPKYLGTQNGKNSKGEACLVSFTRNQVGNVVAIVDRTLGFVEAGICQAKKDNAATKLPEAVGDSLDLAAAMTSLFGAKVTVGSATVKRSDDLGGRKLFLIDMVVTPTKGGKQTIRIAHQPAADGTNATYNGTMYMKMEGDLGNAPVLGAGQEAKYRVMSIVYAKTAATVGKQIKFELRTMTIAKSLIDLAFNSAGQVDLNASGDFSGTALSNGYGTYKKIDGTAYAQANDAVDGITYVAFDINSDTNEGSLSYWKNPGGNYYENARGFNIAVAKNATTGVLEGCAISGAATTDFTNGTSIRRFLKEGGDLKLQAKGSWHPFLNTPTATLAVDTVGTPKTRTQQDGKTSKWYVPAISDLTLAAEFVTGSSGNIITRQCFKQNATTFLWELDTTAVTETAGYELIRSTDTTKSAKFIAPPSIGDAKPLDVKVSKLFGDEE